MDELNRKMLDLDIMPESPLRRYVRGIYAMSDADSSFEEFEREYWSEYDARVAKLDQTNPIEYNKTIKTGPYSSVQIFKRKGQDWQCSRMDTTPNLSAGGCGSISIEEAMALTGLKIDDLK